MEEWSVERYLYFFSQEKCNIEIVSQVEGHPSQAQVYVRIRPYGNTKLKTRMFVGGGYSLHQALDNAYRNYDAGKAMFLDWAYRTWDDQHYEIPTQDELPEPIEASPKGQGRR